MKPHTVADTVADTVTRTHWTSFYPSFYLAGDSLTKGRGRPAEEFAGLLDVREDGTVPGVVGGALVDPFMAARVIKPRALEAVVTRAKRLSATEPAPIAVAAKRLVKRASLELPAIPDIDPFLDPELLPTPRDDDDDDDEYHHHHHDHHDHGHEHGGSRVSGRGSSSQSMLGTPLRMNGAASRLNLNLTSLTAADGGAGAHVGDGEREPYSARARPDGQAIVDGGLGATWPARSSVEGEGGAEGPPEPTEQYVMRVRCVRCVCVCVCVISV